MPKRVAVVGSSPTWRRGVGAVLDDAGFEPVECESIRTWKPGRHGIAVVLGVRTNDALDEIELFSAEFPHIPVVAVLPELEMSELAAAIRAGATAALGEEESIESYHTVLEAAIAGRTAVPVALARALAVRIPSAPDADAWITSADGERLRSLAAGTTVATLAEDSGYSEREMFRMLNDLYVRIGVRNRTQAIIWATRHGVLDER